MPSIKIQPGFSALQPSIGTIVGSIERIVCSFRPPPTVLQLPTAPPTRSPSTTVPTLAPIMPPTKCDHRPSQVMLALDGSSSISDKDWGHFIVFTEKLIQALPIGKGRMKVGIIEFATTALLVQSLTDNKSVLEEVGEEKLTRKQGIRAYMSRATALARMQLTDKSVPRTLVVITNGLPSSRSTTTAQFHAAKAEGIKVVLVTVGLYANMLPPTASWLSVPAITIRAGFGALESALDGIVEAIATTVCSASDVSTAVPGLTLALGPEGDEEDKGEKEGGPDNEPEGKSLCNRMPFTTLQKQCSNEFGQLVDEGHEHLRGCSELCKKGVKVYTTSCEYQGSLRIKLHLAVLVSRCSSLARVQRKPLAVNKAAGVVCGVGDAVLASWAPNQGEYDATIASIKGNTITVNWADGDTSHRDVDAAKVIKAGQACGGTL